MIGRSQARPAPGRPRSRWRLWFWRVLRLYLLYLLVLFFAQRWILFPGQFRQALPVSEAQLSLSGGHSLEMKEEGKAWWFPVDPEIPALVIFHGNGELIEDWWELATSWKQGGRPVLLVEYPGYGGVPGPPTREGMLATGREAIAEVRRRGQKRMIGLGVSLGTGVATAMAAEGLLDGLVLVAPYTSLSAMAGRRGAPGFLVRDDFNNESALSLFRGPTLIIHGRKDRVIPISMSRRLRTSAAGPIDLVELEDRGHCGVLGGDFLAEVENWLAANFPHPPPGARTSGRPRTMIDRPAGFVRMVCPTRSFF